MFSFLLHVHVCTVQDGTGLNFVYLFPSLHQLFMVTTASHWCVSYMLCIQVVELMDKSIQCVSSTQGMAIMKGVVSTLKASERLSERLPSLKPLLDLLWKTIGQKLSTYVDSGDEKVFLVSTSSSSLFAFLSFFIFLFSCISSSYHLSLSLFLSLPFSLSFSLLTCFIPHFFPLFLCFNSVFYFL